MGPARRKGRNEYEVHTRTPVAAGLYACHDRLDRIPLFGDRMEVNERDEMSTEHTKGTWTIERATNTTHHGFNLRAKSTGGYISGVICQFVKWDIRPTTLAEQLANIHLIAAAPDLLAACKFAKAQIKKGAHKKALPVLRAAIAKAKGGAE